MNQVIIFGLDGATFDVLDHLVVRGVMPNLGEFLKSSARGLLRSTVPPLTPIAWTSLVTGRTPGNHGVLGFFQYESAESLSLRIVSSREVKTETVWAMVNRHGLRAASLNFPVHCPPPRIDGYVIPGWVPWKWLKPFSHPKKFIESLQESIPSFNLQELAMDFEQEKKSIAGAPVDNYEEWVELHRCRDRQWFSVLRHVLDEHPCELCGIVLDGVDKLQHLLWPYLDPRVEPAEPSENYLRIRELCWSYFRQIDGFLGELMRRNGNRHIVLVSDHGFTGTDRIFFVNTWLESQGYLTWKPEMEIVADDDHELEPDFYRLSAFDMTQTKAFALTASSNGIHIVVQGRKTPDGISPEEYHEFRRSLADALLTRCTDPDTGEPLVRRVWFREEIFSGPALDLAPDLTLELADHGFFSVRRSARIVTQRRETMGTHHPDGVFAVTGPNIQAGVLAEPLRLADITPTVLHLLGVPVPAGLEGRVAQEVLTDGFARAHPILTSAASAPLAPLDEPGLDDQTEVMERLRALGYIE